MDQIQILVHLVHFKKIKGLSSVYPGQFIFQDPHKLDSFVPVHWSCCSGIKVPHYIKTYTFKDTMSQNGKSNVLLRLFV